MRVDRLSMASPVKTAAQPASRAVRAMDPRRADRSSGPDDAADTSLLPARAAQIVEFASDAIISKDRAGLITSWNLGAERLYGYASHEILERPISLLIPAQLEGEELRLLERVLAGERIDGYETLRVAKDGRTIDVSLTLFALRGDDGEIVGAASIAHDISEQVATQQELQSSERGYREILESTTEGVWRVDPQMVTDYVNPSLARMLGYTVEEMLGRHLSEFLDPQELGTARASIHRQTAGAKERLEHVLRRKDGGEVRALMSVTAVRDDSGAPVGNLAIVSDITRQRETEIHLRETETFLAGLTASMEEGLLTLDADGRIAAVNDAATSILGFAAEELLGRALCEALGCERRRDGACDAHSCRLAAIGSCTEPVRFEDEVFTCSDGKRLPVDLSSAPIGADADGGTGRVIVFREISERRKAAKQAERELEEMSWVGRLRDAIDEERLVLATQPIVELATGEVSSQELLVRLRDRGGDLVMPGKFLPAAERFGLIGALDRWVLVQAARMAANGQAVNVNLSAQSLGDPEMAELAETIILAARSDPTLITFEITETALTEHLDLASRFTTRLAALGCAFALDDFGTGYGAFTYLKTLPIKHLKIDIEFVRDLLQNEASQHLVSATVQLARSFGQKTVAEGVEDTATLERLRELEVDYVQGYFVGRPVLAAAA
jgi:PAS domain S-box-containing protein